MSSSAAGKKTDQLRRRSARQLADQLAGLGAVQWARQLLPAVAARATSSTVSLVLKDITVQIARGVKYAARASSGGAPVR